MTAKGAITDSNAHDRYGAAIQQLAKTDGALADALTHLMLFVAEEALQNTGFRARLTAALVVGSRGEQAVSPTAPRTIRSAPASDHTPAKARSKRTRRAPGPWDPYSVYAEVGEAGLRDRLGQLELEQLRDLIAEHGMNTDGLAMRWTKADRVVGRIVDRVVDRSAKGDAFR